MSINRAGGIKKNIFFSILNQLIILALGIVLPRLILVSYGSEVNGLLSTVTQIFTYVALLEAGIGNASVNALYKPIAKNDQYTISDIFSATQKYYHKITYIYVACVIVLSFAYPLVINTELSYLSVVLIFLFQGMSGALTFYFVAAYKQVLIADGKNYIVQNITLLIYILSSVAKILLMCNGFDIVILQFVYFIIYCIQVWIYVAVMKKKYKWLEKHNNPSMSALAQRNAFLIHEISGTIFSSTDAFVLSTFCSLKVASVYAVYNMVFTALNSMINSINSGLIYILGQIYAKDEKEYEKVHDTYDSFYMALVFSLISVAYVLILPFVNLYTKGVADIKYVDYKLPLLFASIQLMSCGRAVSARLITIAGHAKATQWRSLAEAAINLTASIILVNWIGIYGVLLGTIIALIYRANDIIIYANRKILKRSSWKTYKKWLLNVGVFIIFMIFEHFVRKQLLFFCKSYIIFALMGMVVTLISMLLYFGIAIMTNQDVLYFIRHFVKK